jgi:hypothetical protein
MEQSVRGGEWISQVFPRMMRIKRVVTKVGDRGVEKDLQIKRERQKYHLKMEEDPNSQQIKEIDVFNCNFQNQR